MMARVRIKDVAEHAGVSVGTVSHVLNHPERVMPDVIERVKASIQELGFVRNATAGTLRSGKRDMIGVSVLDIANPFFTEAAAAAEKELGKESYIFMLSSSQADPLREEHILRTFEEQQVAGILLTPATSNIEQAKQIQDRGTRVVLFDYVSTDSSLSQVAVDDEKGAFLATEHLIQQGHTRLTFICGPDNMRQSVYREAGVRKAWKKYGLHMKNLQVYYAERYDALSGQHIMNMILEHELPTAIFCANDLLAFGALNVLRAQGISIPSDLSIIGFDDIPMAKHFFTPLTTVRQPMEELGRLAAQLVLEQDARPRQVFLKPELIIRESTSVPRLR